MNPNLTQGEPIFGPFISRKQAEDQGLKYYYTGPCRKGHLAVKHISAGCIDCSNERRRKNFQDVEQSCDHCGKTFHAARMSMYCSKPCGTAAWRLQNKEHLKAYSQAQIIDYKKQYQRRKAKIQADPSYAQKRDQVLRKARKRWVNNNPDKVRNIRLTCERRLYATNTEYRLKHNLRSRVGSALRAQKAGKNWSLLDIVGCSTKELMAHLESQFTPGMTWDSWAHDGWHIDHIRPCASFDLTDETQQLECFHYTNLQPLWAVDNLTKSDKFNGPLSDGREFQSARL